MGKPNFSEDFKRDAVHQITVRGYPVREVSERLGGRRVSWTLRRVVLSFLHSGSSLSSGDPP